MVNPSDVTWVKKCSFTDAIYLGIHLKLSIEPAHFGCTF